MGRKNEGELSPLIQDTIPDYEEDYLREINTNKTGFFSRKKSLLPRLFTVDGGGVTEHPNGKKLPKNEIHNTRYNLITFFPKCLYEQFKSFINFVTIF